jgi:NAD(P)-dependent dehydrogenase (short-subunit alcohol dehydrogenase family)
LGETAGLSGRTAVVLGASSPYGAATVRALARESVNLALGGRDREKLEVLEREVEAMGGRAIVVGTHLAKRHHPAHLVQATIEAFGAPDFLLFMACSTAPPLRSLDVDAWERSLDVNLKGLIYCLAATLPVMRENGGGRVVVLSVEDPQGVPDPLLRACRAAVRTILEELAREYRSNGIHVAEITADAPGVERPEDYAETVVRALSDPTKPDGKLHTYRI